MRTPPLRLRRRTVLAGLLGAVATVQADLRLPATAPAFASVSTHSATGLPLDPRTRATLEAFADTMIPGQKRGPGDRAVAGAARGPGAVQAGVINLLTSAEAQVAPLLPAVSTLLDTQATAWAATHDLTPDPSVPPFVGLEFGQRTLLCAELLHVRDAPADNADHDRRLLTLVALMAFVAFHTAGHRHTAAAVRRGHPGLAWLRFPAPGPDGLWRYPRFSYGRRLARRHPATTPTGSPA